MNLNGKIQTSILINSSFEQHRSANALWEKKKPKNSMKMYIKRIYQEIWKVMVKATLSDKAAEAFNIQEIKRLTDLILFRSYAQNQKSILNDMNWLILF